MSARSSQHSAYGARPHSALGHRDILCHCRQPALAPCQQLRAPGQWCALQRFTPRTLCAGRAWQHGHAISPSECARGGKMGTWPAPANSQTNPQSPTKRQTTAPCRGSKKAAAEVQVIVRYDSTQQPPPGETRSLLDLPKFIHILCLALSRSPLSSHHPPSAVRPAGLLALDRPLRPAHRAILLARPSPSSRIAEILPRYSLHPRKQRQLV